MDKLTTVKRALGLFSLALGVVAVASPRKFSSKIGLDESPEMVAAFGARELAAGAALLSPVKPSPFLWTRVIGDAFDLAGLAKAFRQPGARKTVLGLAAGAVIAITLVDILAAAKATEQGR
jgi:hypothetical protein